MKTINLNVPEEVYEHWLQICKNGGQLMIQVEANTPPNIVPLDYNPEKENYDEYFVDLSKVDWNKEINKEIKRKQGNN